MNRALRIIFLFILSAHLKAMDQKNRQIIVPTHRSVEIPISLNDKHSTIQQIMKLSNEYKTSNPSHNLSFDIVDNAVSLNIASNSSTFLDKIQSLVDDKMFANKELQVITPNNSIDTRPNKPYKTPSHELYRAQKTSDGFKANIPDIDVQQWAQMLTPLNQIIKSDAFQASIADTEKIINILEDLATNKYIDADYKLRHFTFNAHVPQAVVEKYKPFIDLLKKVLYESNGALREFSVIDRRKISYVINQFLDDLLTPVKFNNRYFLIECPNRQKLAKIDLSNTQRVNGFLDLFKSHDTYAFDIEIINNPINKANDKIIRLLGLGKYEQALAEGEKSGAFARFPEFKNMIKLALKNNVDSKSPVATVSASEVAIIDPSHSQEQNRITPILDPNTSIAENHYNYQYTVYNTARHLSENSKNLLKALGIEKYPIVDAQLNLSKKQESLIYLNTDLINKSSQLHSTTKDNNIKEIVIDNVKMNLVAYEMILQNYIPRAQDVIKNCYKVYCKLNELEQAYQKWGQKVQNEISRKALEYTTIFSKAFYNRSKEIVRHPLIFIGQQASGIYNATLAALRAANKISDYYHNIVLKPLRSTPAEVRKYLNNHEFKSTWDEPKRKLDIITDYIKSTAEKLINMSANDWDEFAKHIAHSSGDFAVDSLATAGLFCGASKVAKKVADLLKLPIDPALAKHLAKAEQKANEIELRFDKTHNAWVMVEAVETELAVATTEGVTSLPVLLEQAENSKLIPKTAKSSLGNVAYDANQLRLLDYAISNSPYKDLFTKHELLVQTAQKYGINNTEEALRVLNINEKKLIQYQEPFKLIENTAKDLEKINSKPRWEKFKYDAAHNGGVSIKTIQEALAGIACEEQGLLKPLIRSLDTAEEFIENVGSTKRYWDVKTPIPFSLKGEYVFKINEFFNSFKKAFYGSEDLILNTSYLNDKDLNLLIEKILQEIKVEDLKRVLCIDIFDINRTNALNQKIAIAKGVF